MKAIERAKDVTDRFKIGPQLMFTAAEAGQMIEAAMTFERKKWNARGLYFPGAYKAEIIAERGEWIALANRLKAAQ